MANTSTAITKQDGGGWIGWIEALELNRQEAIPAAAPDYTEEPVSL